MLAFVKFRLEFWSRETILKFREKLWVLSLLIPLPYLVSNGELQVAALHHLSWNKAPSGVNGFSKSQKSSKLLSISVLLSFLQFPFGSLALLSVSFHLHRLNLCSSFVSILLFSTAAVDFNFVLNLGCLIPFDNIWTSIWVLVGAKSWWVLELEHWSNSK